MTGCSEEKVGETTMLSVQGKNRIAMWAAVAVSVAGVICCVCVAGRSIGAPMAVLGGIILMLIMSIAAMAVQLRRSLSITLYSYSNIGLIGGIMFASVFAVVLLAYFALFLHADELSLSSIFKTALDIPRKFSYYAVFVIFGISFLLGISNIALMYHEGFRPRNALSVLLAAFYIGGTVLIYWLSDVLTDRVFASQGLTMDPLFVVLNTVIPLFLLLMLCYFECIFAGAAIMGWKAAHQKPAYDKDYIIILGCSIDKKGGLLPLLKGRVNRAIRFAWEQEIATGKPLKYVPSGGQGPNEVMSEGSAMELYLKTRGAEDYEVFPEKASTKTLENMKLSKQIIDGLDPDARIAFATTNYHMLRSGILARRAGINAEGIAGDTKWYFWPNGFVREFFGILAMNIKVHIWVAAIVAAACAVIGCVGYLGNLL